MHLQLARRGGGVDAFPQADERHAQGLELVEQGDQVLEAAAQAIQPPAHQDIEPPPGFTSVRTASKAGRRSRLPDTPRSTNSTAVQPRAATYRRSSASWFSRFLIEGRDPGVDGSSLWGG